MVEVNVTYQGELHCSIVHEPSSATLETDAPRDNHGRGESFSPTDLLAAGLGACMATIMGITSRAKSYDIDGTKIRVVKGMTGELPRRIAKLTVTIDVPSAAAAKLDEAARAELEHAANTCPVRLSILDAIEVPTEFVWD
jgi:putative redox protein